MFIGRISTNRTEDNTQGKMTAGHGLRQSYKPLFSAMQNNILHVISCRLGILFKRFQTIIRSKKTSCGQKARAFSSSTRVSVGSTVWKLSCLDSPDATHPLAARFIKCARIALDLPGWELKNPAIGKGNMLILLLSWIIITVCKSNQSNPDCLEEG